MAEKNYLNNDQIADLLARLQSGDQDAGTELFDNFEALAIFIANRYIGRFKYNGVYLNKQDIEDVRSSARSGLWYGLTMAKHSNGIKSYLEKYIINDVLAFLNDKSGFSVCVSSLDVPVMDDEDTMLVDTLSGPDILTPSRYVVDNDFISRATAATRAFYVTLSDRDKYIFINSISLDGKPTLSLTTMAGQLGISIQRVGKIRDRIFNNYWLFINPDGLSR